MIMHVDMDAFFSSVEQLDNPALKGKCVIVGGTSNRGVVATCSYEARRFGVHSAMPMFQARQRCPGGVFVKPRHSRYKEVSGKVMSLLGGFAPIVEPVSIDEAYLDISGCETLYGSPCEIGQMVKQRIRDAVSLTCSVGIAPLRFLAKIASGMDKPDGLTYIPPEEVPGFISTLMIEKVPGVGAHTGRVLERMGIKTLGDVQKYPEKQLLDRLGRFGHRLLALSKGIDRSIVQPVRPVKSVSSEHTLSRDTSDKALLKRYLLKHAEDVGRQLRRHALKAKTVVLKIKHADFTQVTRQTPVKRPTNASKVLYREAAGLLDRYKLVKSVRLIGLGAVDLSEKGRPIQMELFVRPDASDEKWEKLDTAVDAITERFGRDVIKKAGLEEKRAEKGGHPYI